MLTAPKGFRTLAVLTNQRPACATTFGRRSVAVAHLCRALQAPKCTADQSAHELAAEPVALVCYICHALFSRAQTVMRFAEYNTHIVPEHLPIDTQERQVCLCWNMLKAEASSSGAAPGAGLSRRKGARDELGALDRWSRDEATLC